MRKRELEREFYRHEDKSDTLDAILFITQDGRVFDEEWFPNQITPNNLAAYESQVAAYHGSHSIDDITDKAVLADVQWLRDIVDDVK